MRRKKRRELRKKQKNLIKRKKSKRIEPAMFDEEYFFCQRECKSGIFFRFFRCHFLKIRFKNKLRTIEPQIWEKIKNNPASF